MFPIDQYDIDADSVETQNLTQTLGHFTTVFTNHPPEVEGLYGRLAWRVVAMLGLAAAELLEAADRQEVRPVAYTHSPRTELAALRCRAQATVIAELLSAVADMLDEELQLEADNV